MRALFLLLVTSVCSSLVFAGAEMPARPAGPVPEKGDNGPAPRVIKGRAIEKPKIGPPLQGQVVARNAPLPAPFRPIGWGFKCNEFYGPTYYDPSYHNSYERLHPTYYPFYHPRLWPNYKAPGQYKTGVQCGGSRSDYYWDSYDDYMRDARYGEHQ